MSVLLYVVSISKVKIDHFVTVIRNKECDIQTAKSTGHGGQHINKRETKVQLTRNRKESKTLPAQYHQRFGELHIHDITDAGYLRLDAQIHRTQDANKELLKTKLTRMIHTAFKPPKAARRMTEPPQHAVDKRIAEKKRKSKIRAMRTRLI